MDLHRKSRSTIRPYSHFNSTTKVDRIQDNRLGDNKRLDKPTHPTITAWMGQPGNPQNSIPKYHFHELLFLPTRHKNACQNARPLSTPGRHNAKNRTIHGVRHATSTTTSSQSNRSRKYLATTWPNRGPLCIVTKKLLSHSYQRVCNQYHSGWPKIPGHGIDLRPTIPQLATRCYHHMVGLLSLSPFQSLAFRHARCPPVCRRRVGATVSFSATFSVSRNGQFYCARWLCDFVTLGWAHCVCLLLQDLLQSCSRGGRRTLGTQNLGISIGFLSRFWIAVRLGLLDFGLEIKSEIKQILVP